ncbi:ATP-NAD kinase family protein [Natronorubrum daqingense]|uniref:N-acetylglucosamine-1-phosphate uridyltransferase n=1 Tax=Natronorubrum daqingense TaxID=588898 RepID=A0A1N6YZG5_9EURY|nr:ATP-NAD kinase family protein [Natronorubrum daqingense]APX95511.1 N-acetylglucosamine-1-phosphate uridyltransferase [Natronorubrum daqingense]SIR19947.1 Predicted polyphosphate-or ATP-dependent NAD kinase [Natronorubrum daqingense]
MESLGVVVNPIAGMGGRVGLKGTDGKLEEARRRGAKARAPDRAREALEAFARRAPEAAVYTGAGVLGETVARDVGLDPHVVSGPQTDVSDDVGPADADTSAADTRATVEALLGQGVDLVLFVGGDGTAVDVATVLEDAGASTPMLGVPAGVKIYSSVFAVTPADAGRIAAEFDRVETREVNDIDEAAYREGEVRTELRAVVPVPVASDVQSSKQVSSGNVDSLAAGFAREVDPERAYVFGPGGTVGAIESELGIDPSPLGVDIWHDEKVLARDATEDDILECLESVDGPVTIVVSPIGGQGFLFGRGNQQLSPAVIRRADEVDIVASGAKLDGIDALHVDTDDRDLNDELRGWQRVRTGRFTTRLVHVV